MSFRIRQLTDEKSYRNQRFFPSRLALIGKTGSRNEKRYFSDVSIYNSHYFNVENKMLSDDQ